MSEQPIGPVEIERALGCVTAHAHAGALGAFAYDVLSAQAEGRSLFSGQKFMSQRAADHGVTSELAQTELGNLLGILERGTSERAELALIAAFALRGLHDALEHDSEAERVTRLDRFVSHMDFLHALTPYRLLPFAHKLLGSEQLTLLYEALATSVLRDDASGADPAVRARNAARLSLLADSATAEPFLARVRAQAKDRGSRALATALLGASLPEPPETTRVSVSGVPSALSRQPWLALLRWLSGFALVAWIVRSCGFVVGLRGDIELELSGRKLLVRRRTTLLGRVVQSSDGFYNLDRISGALRRGRYALLRTVIGVLSLCVGVLVGGQLAFDATRGGAFGLLWLSALVIALGTLIDLTFEVWLPGTRARVELQMDLIGERSIRVAGVPLDEAERFLRALREQLGAVG